MTTTNKRPSYTSVGTNVTDEKQHRQQIATVLNNVLAGNQNNVLDVTLNAGATSTTITDSRLTAFSHLSMTPVTANAMTATKAGVFPSARGTGTATLTHAAASATDQHFTVEITG